MKAEVPKREASETLLRRGLFAGAWPRLVEGLLLRPPAEESVWLVERSAAVAMKPGARQPCLMKNKNLIK